MLLEKLRIQVLETARRMLADGIARGAQGNVSAFDREAGYVAITPSALPYDQIEAEDICIVDLERKVVAGKWRPTSEIALHMAFYHNRPDVNAVVHSHAPYTTAFGITGERFLPMVLNEAAMCLGAPLPVAPYAPPGTEELAQLILEVVGQGTGAIMAHHGLVTVGPSLALAYDATLAAENTAHIIILVRAMGAKEITLGSEEVKKLRAAFLNQYKATKLS